MTTAPEGSGAASGAIGASSKPKIVRPKQNQTEHTSQRKQCPSSPEDRSLTSRPFGVGFISPFPDTDELARVALEEGVAAINHSFADPTPFVAPAHAAGVKVFVQVQTLKQAITAAQAGDNVIAIRLRASIGSMLITAGERLRHVPGTTPELVSEGDTL